MTTITTYCLSVRSRTILYERISKVKEKEQLLAFGSPYLAKHKFPLGLGS